MRKGKRTTACAWRKQAPDRVCLLAMPLRRASTNACANEGGGATPAQSVHRKRLQSGESHPTPRTTEKTSAAAYRTTSMGWWKLTRFLAARESLSPRQQRFGCPVGLSLEAVSSFDTGDAQFVRPIPLLSAEFLRDLMVAHDDAIHGWHRDSPNRKPLYRRRQRRARSRPRGSPVGPTPGQTSRRPSGRTPPGRRGSARK